ncbi:hypothetical protein GOV12_04430 [Candidatus Pacearchaeota archaeon]|nr:hypothetical protein [Candidatus Pacearchaeota archaeon]
MILKDSLVIWCQYEYHAKTMRIPLRIQEYLNKRKPVLYCPSSKDSISDSFLFSGVELILSSGGIVMQDRNFQQRRLVERLRDLKVNSVEICGAIVNTCLDRLKKNLDSKGFIAEINMDHSITISEMFGV